MGCCFNCVNDFFNYEEKITLENRNNKNSLNQRNRDEISYNNKNSSISNIDEKKGKININNINDNKEEINAENIFNNKEEINVENIDENKNEINVEKINENKEEINVENIDGNKKEINVEKINENKEEINVENIDGNKDEINAENINENKEEINLENINNNKEEINAENINNNKEENKNVKLKIFGLVNHNNYCFMNSSLQIFFHLEQFVEKIVNIKLNNNNQLLSIEIQNILKITENNSIADPIKIKNIINSIQPEYKNDDQEDAFELITIFLEQLKQELKNIDNNYKPNININDNDELNAWNKFKKRHIDKYNSFIWELFYGIIKKEIICEKKHRILINYIPFNIIELPQFHENITLINLIEYFQKENKVFAEYECNKCGEIDKYFIKKTIVTLPKYLLFYSDKNKIKTINEIKYKDIIKEESKNNDIYQLKGLIGYNGNSYSGHYYSRCKIYNDWYYFSDSNFKKIETPNISQNDMILVFELKTN